MCGRFENKTIEKSLLELFIQNGLTAEFAESNNTFNNDDIRPTEKILCVILKDSVYKISKVTWGIKFGEDSPLIFNSRIETIKEKKYWTSLFSKNKCIVPMTGFYEWKTEGKKKTKFRISLQDENLFFVPALFIPDKDKNITASLITTTPNKFIEKIHHRMPVIFDFDKAIDFLNGTTEENLNNCLPLSDSKLMVIEPI